MSVELVMSLPSVSLFFFAALVSSIDAFGASFSDGGCALIIRVGWTKNCAGRSAASRQSRA